MGRLNVAIFGLIAIVAWRSSVRASELTSPLSAVRESGALQSADSPKDPSVVDGKDSDEADQSSEDKSAGQAEKKSEAKEEASSEDSDEGAKKDSDDKEDSPAESAEDEESKSESKESAAKKSDDSAEKSKAKKADEKKPDDYKVAEKKLEVTVDLDGVFVAQESTEVALRPESWASFKVVEAVAHGATVRKGEVLVKFDDRDIEKSLADKSLDERLAEVALMEAEEDFPRLEKSVELALDEAQRSYDELVDEYKRFQETMRPLSERMSTYNLKSAEQYRDNAAEELHQLQKMYEADELTEETEEIVLKRQKFELEVADFYVEYSKVNHDYTMNVSIPRRDVALKAQIDDARITLERAKMAKSLGLSQKRYELQQLRERRARDVEDHAELVADRALMTLKAPCDGVVYYGRCTEGRWSEVGAYESKLVPFGAVSPNSVLMTIVSERPLTVRTTVGEKDLVSLDQGQSAVLKPAADPEQELSAKVEELGGYPRTGNQFSVSLKVVEDELPAWIKPGMTCKATVTVYKQEKAIVIPGDLVQKEEDDPKAKYVMVRVEDEEEPERRDLKLGKTKGKAVEVLKGLKVGDQIVKGAKDKSLQEAESED
jgi:multidrug resistance efflux pump